MRLWESDLVGVMRSEGRLAMPWQSSLFQCVQGCLIGLFFTLSMYQMFLYALSKGIGLRVTQADTGDGRLCMRA